MKSVKCGMTFEMFFSGFEEWTEVIAKCDGCDISGKCKLLGNMKSMGKAGIRRGCSWKF